MDLIAWVNGEFVPLEEARVSILDRGFLYGDGLFETLYGRGGKIFRLDEHLDRLSAGAESLKIPLPVSKDKLQALAIETLCRNPLGEAIIKIQLTRGAGSPGLVFPKETQASLVIQARPHQKLPAEWLEQGVAACTANQAPPVIGLLDRQVKSCNYLLNILTQNQARETGFFEALYLDADNGLTEGTISNVFVVKDGCVRTPPVGKQVLNGITRRVILEICSAQSIECREERVSLDSALAADELFITNSGIGVLPVTRINYDVLATGSPGPVTRRLAEAYLKTVDGEVGSC